MAPRVGIEPTTNGLTVRPGSPRDSHGDLAVHHKELFYKYLRATTFQWRPVVAGRYSDTILPPTLFWRMFLQHSRRRPVSHDHRQGAEREIEGARRVPQYLSDGGARNGGRLVARKRRRHTAFLFRYFDDSGRKRWFPLGQYDEKGTRGLSLTQAREAAAKYSAVYVSGIRNLHQYVSVMYQSGWRGCERDLSSGVKE